ncbi:E3 ubiquitin-protein ligase rad18 [Lecanicillium sp. MT-2017a]|nr:E3 ubiquitin-protein ligase rad18 [Lecanicillium sp. MT-2017a]
MPVDDVADSTDWLSTPLSGFAAVESALRCEVCKDFYKTPMITTCSHTFCSICIRRALSSDGKCPLCRAPDQELKLRSNWSMEETVESFTKARQSALDLARNANAASKRSPKRKVEEAHAADNTAPNAKRLRSSARLSSRTETESSPPVTQTVDVVEDSEDEDFVPENKQKEPTTQPTHVLSGGQMQRQQPRNLDRLPAVNYSMYKEQALRKKLADLGIPNQGPRQLLERRHKEWITIWNANCDAMNPRKRSELLHDLDVWERTQGGRAPVSGRAVQTAMAIKDKEFDGAAWATKHDDSFKDLIANARKSRLEAKQKAAEAAAEEASKGDTIEDSTNDHGAVNQEEEVVPASPLQGDMEGASLQPLTDVTQHPLPPEVQMSDIGAFNNVGEGQPNGLSSQR